MAWLVKLVLVVTIPSSAHAWLARHERLLDPQNEALEVVTLWDTSPDLSMGFMCSAKGYTFHLTFNSDETLDKMFTNRDLRFAFGDDTASLVLPMKGMLGGIGTVKPALIDLIFSRFVAARHTIVTVKLDNGAMASGFFRLGDEFVAAAGDFRRCREQHNQGNRT